MIRARWQKMKTVSKSNKKPFIGHLAPAVDCVKSVFALLLMMFEQTQAFKGGFWCVI